MQLVVKQIYPLLIFQVKLGLYDSSGNELIYMIFNATAADRDNWFHNTRLISSSYTDISTEPFLYFSIPG